MDKMEGTISIMNCNIKADFDAEIQRDGSLKIWFNDVIVIPPDKFKLKIVGDMR